MDRAAAERTFTPAAVEALRAFPVEPGEVRLVSLSENVTFRVADRRDGASYVLRLHRPGYHTLEELNSERVWIRALGDAGIAVPVAVPTRDGREYTSVDIEGGGRRYAGMTRWTEGEVLAELLRHTEDAGVFEDYFAQLGGFMATMHDQASAWQVPATFRRHAFDTDGLMGEAPFWGRFWDNPALSGSERRLLLETRERIRRVLDRYGRHPSTFSLIHADMHPGNLLVSDDRLTVIDFDDAGFGWHQYDIAVALFSYRALPSFPATERAFLDGYRATRSITDEALALVPMFLLVRGMALIGWIDQRPELERSGFLGALKDAVCAECAVFEEPC